MNRSNRFKNLRSAIVTEIPCGIIVFFFEAQNRNINYSTPNDWGGFWAFCHRKSKKNSCSSSKLSKALHVSSNFQPLTGKKRRNLAPSQRSCCFSCSWFVEDQCLELGRVPLSQRWSRGSVLQGPKVRWRNKKTKLRDRSFRRNMIRILLGISTNNLK